MTVALFELERFTLTDVIVIAGVLGFLVERLVDARGWSRSSRVLRQENQDLIRRNTELEQTVGRHEDTITSQGAQIILLQEKVADLEKRDQAAVLRAIELHEQNAAQLNDGTHQVLVEIRDLIARTKGDPS